VIKRFKKSSWLRLVFLLPVPSDGEGRVEGDMDEMLMLTVTSSSIHING